MTVFLETGLVWWITAFELPCLAGLLYLIYRNRRDVDLAQAELGGRVDAQYDQMRSALSDFKLEAAKTYSAIVDVRELEGRIVSHLLRIEAKLDTTALKTEALRAEYGNYHG